MGQIEAKFLHSQLQKAHGRINWAVHRWNQAITEEGPTLAGVIYHGQPSIYPYLDTVRQLPPLLESYHTLNLKRGVVREDDQQMLALLDSHDVFHLRVNGLSLADIAGMELTNGSLSTSDISRVRRMFYVTAVDWVLAGILPESRDRRWIRQWATALAVQSVLDQYDERKEVCPKGLRPLRDRLVSFFDYPTRLMIDFSTSDQEDIWLFKTLRFKASYLTPALGSFMPARLGIMPSSAIKLFKERVDKSIIPAIAWSRVSQALEKQMRRAYYPDALPQEIRPFQHTDTENDQATTTLLKAHYRDQYAQDILRVESNGPPNLLTERLSRYHSALREDIGRSRYGRVIVDLPDDQVISRVTIACQNQLALIFLLHFKDSGVKLAVEMSWNPLDQQGRLYGLPHRLVRDYPHIGDLLLEMILPPILRMAQSRHPQIEPPPLPKRVIANQPSQLSSAPQEEGNREKLRPSLVGRVRNLITEPQPPQPHPVPTTLFQVNYQPEGIARLLGEEISSVNVRRVVRALERFVYGQRNVEKALRSDTLLLELRVGKDFRVILRPVGQNTFDLFEVGRRREMFKPRRQRLIG